MSNLEMTICNVLCAENEEDREAAMMELKRAMQQHERKTDVDGEIRDLFLECGVPDHLNGYEVAVKAVQLVIEDKKILNDITTGLYPALATTFNSSISKVERAIRNTVTETFLRGNLTRLDQYFGNFINPKSGKVSNGEFVGRMANLVKSRIRNK